ncbi:hypothetical protein [Enterobacter asburiae]|uniref:hypothetical protein n=1 Tax=Enterobacter asburiae TaxID=61645 RepID=UPI0011D17E76|nr:hypothetical protein [Enterobacter asburiae]
MRAAQPIIDLIIELDGLRGFGLGTEKRPVFEQTVRQFDEQKLELEMVLLAFDVSSTGTPVQQFLLYITLYNNVFNAYCSIQNAIISHHKLAR